jgi:hypothetical protein
MANAAKNINFDRFLNKEMDALRSTIIDQTANDLLEIKQVLGDPESIEDLEQIAHDFRFYALGYYCGYVDTHGTDHGLSKSLGIRMEKILTLEALKRIFDHVGG